MFVWWGPGEPAPRILLRDEMMAAAERARRGGERPGAQAPPTDGRLSAGCAPCSWARGVVLEPRRAQVCRYSSASSPAAPSPPPPPAAAACRQRQPNTFCRLPPFQARMARPTSSSRWTRSPSSLAGTLALLLPATAAAASLSRHAARRIIVTFLAQFVLAAGSTAATFAS